MTDSPPNLHRAPLSRAIWAIAAPAMLTNVATALFGLCDMWVIGRSGDAAAQGAVEVGAKLLMTLLIVFNFLKSGTVALAAQAAGRGDDDAQATILVRAVAAALAIGVGILLIWPLAVPFGLELFGAGPHVAEAARTYVDIRYPGSIAWLVNCALVGWLIGRRRMRAVLAIEVASNLFHIALDLILVLGLHLGVAGVASATLVSEIAKLVILALIVLREPPARHALALVRRAETWALAAIGELFRLNRDLFGRTVLLMVSIVLVTWAGAQQGATVLAANAILFQLFMLATMVLDGFESAAQVLCGEAVGARDRELFSRLVRTIMAWSGVVALVVSVVYAAGGGALASLFSTNAAVVETVQAHRVWAALLPVLSVASFIYDGVFIGAGWTRALLLTMAAALVAFAVLLLAAGPLGNHGLWLAFTLFFVCRAAGQALILPRLQARAFA